MKLCIFGAGAIGGFIAAKLMQYQNLNEHIPLDISLVARGAHLQAMQENGLTLIENDTPTTTPIKAVENPAELGVQDYLFITLKAHSAPDIAAKLAPLIGENTTIVSGVNGIPWWYFYQSGCSLENTRLASVDPDDKQWQHFGPEKMLGCVVYPATEIIKPAVIKHIEGYRFSLGEPDGRKSDRAVILSRLLMDAGLKAPVRPKIRDEIWVKLWGNLSFNPISALTHATLDVLCTDSSSEPIVRNMMQEAENIAHKLGVKFPVSLDQRIQGGAKVRAHRTSMLQDLDQGRPMEIDALVKVVQELGQRTNTNTPTIDTVLGLIQLRGKIAGTYG